MTLAGIQLVEMGRWGKDFKKSRCYIPFLISQCNVKEGYTLVQHVCKLVFNSSSRLFYGKLHSRGSEDFQ